MRRAEYIREKNNMNLLKGKLTTGNSFLFKCT